MFRRQSSLAQNGADAMDMTVAGKAEKKDEEKLPKPARGRMWGLNKGDWPWLLLGLVGAIIAGGTTPSEGTFIAHVQVSFLDLHPFFFSLFFLSFFSSLFGFLARVFVTASLSVAAKHSAIYICPDGEVRTSAYFFAIEPKG